MNLGTVYKEVGEKVTRVVDFANDLIAGETLSSISSITATVFPSGADVTSSIIVPGGFIQPATSNVQFQMQGGDVGTLYNVTITVTTNIGNTYQAMLTLVVGLSIDLTTLTNVANWIAPYTPGQSVINDQDIQDAITAFSAYVLRLTGRGPADGSYPTQSPFVGPVSYSETYDGSGTQRQPIRNWPIVSVASVTVNGQTIPQSVNLNTAGWVVDGDAQFISLRGGFNPTAATFQNYPYQRNYGYAGGFCAGIQNVEVAYTAGFATVPMDLEMAARKTVALNYKRRSWIGQRTQALAQGAGTVTFGTWEMDTDAQRTIAAYRRMTG